MLVMCPTALGKCTIRNAENTVVQSGSSSSFFLVFLCSTFSGRIFNVRHPSRFRRKAATIVAAHQLRQAFGSLFIPNALLLGLLLGDVNHVGLRIQDPVKLNLFAFKVLYSRLVVEIVSGTAYVLQNELLAGLRDRAGKSL